MASLLRTTLRTRLAAVPCTNTTRSFASGLAAPSEDRRNSSQWSDVAPRYSRAGGGQRPPSSSSRTSADWPNHFNERPSSSSLLRDGQPKLRNPLKPRGPPRKGRGPRQPTQDDPRLPTKSRLPPADSTPTLADLDPEVLHDYRLALMSRMGRVPSPDDLEHNLRTWVSQERKKETAEIQRAFKKLQMVETTAEKLDIAWEWQRKADEATGRLRTEEEQRKDRLVRGRVLERARERAQEEAERREGLEQRRAKLSKGQAREEVVDIGRSAREDRSARGSRTREQPPEVEATPEREPLNPPEWLKHRRAMKDKFPDGWSPPKRISREASELLRILQRSDPATYTTVTLAERFKISPEAVRRILKSQFELSPEEKAKREEKRLRREALRREQEREEGGKTWAGDVVGERGEMRRLREEDWDLPEKGEW